MVDFRFFLIFIIMKKKQTQMNNYIYKKINIKMGRYTNPFNSSLV